ncbi:family S53 protease [Mycena albidolilacea]|uniref:Family S53 protease n=1 Tax=Mycena albidolilacea TaxID=1033008 RepID=A0AAD6Z6E1_9AGAR|nr:family S53 protease [Mycena albidolilacea]
MNPYVWMLLHTTTLLRDCLGCQHARKSALWTISLKEEVEKFVAPSQDTAAQVQSWLALNNLTSSALTAVGDWIAVDMAVSHRLLAAEFSTFQNEETDHTVDRTLSYAIPSILKSGINTIYPTVTFRGSEQIGFCCKRDATVQYTLRAFLNRLQMLNVLAVSGFSNVFANKHDLKAFLEEFRPHMNPNIMFDLISIDGGINNQLPAGASISGTIVIQYATGLATGVAVSYISTGPLDSDDTLAAFLQQANYLVSSATPPQTIVNTFPGLECEVSPQIAESLCNAYAQLAARNISYIVDTGLWGAGGIPFAECIPFDPPFPASCPFVTATTQPKPRGPLSGGGLPNFFKRPKYQDAAVAAYVKTIGADASSPLNVSGRAVPDVSAMNGATWIADGTLIDFASTTAFSVDIFAGAVALLTNERIANGAAFNDMLTGIPGSNPGCGDTVFNATEGWDPVTGFGSLNYTKLRDVCSKF